MKKTIFLTCLVSILLCAVVWVACDAAIAGPFIPAVVQIIALTDATDTINMNNHDIINVTGVVLTAPNNTKWRLVVDNQGILSTVPSGG